MKERLRSLQKYIEVYRCVGIDTLDERELKERLKTEVSKSVLGDKVKESMSGEAELLAVKDNKVAIDLGAVRSFMEDLCREIGTDPYILFAGPVPAAKGRKSDAPVYGRIEDVKESPVARQLKSENLEYKGKIKKLEEEIVMLRKENLESLCNGFGAAMDKKIVLTPSIKVFGSAFEEDIFLHNPTEMMDTSYSISRHGGERVSFYTDEKDKKRELTVENVRSRVAEALMKCGFFEKLLMDEQIADRKLASVKLKDKKEITESDINANRKESIKMLLQDTTLNNQAKLAFYAGWYEYRGTEMEDLLNFAGAHSVDANYVIQLLERPGAYNNYQNIRGFLRQACKGSEARIKREAAKELIAGEWYVVANYNGRPCRFQMLPVDELLEFRKALKKHLYSKALFELEKMIGTYRKAAFVDGDSEKELLVRNVGFQALEEECYAEASKMIHQYEVACEGDVNASVLNDSTSEDFAEFEVDENDES